MAMYPIYILNQERKYGFCQEKVANLYESLGGISLQISSSLVRGRT